MNNKLEVLKMLKEREIDLINLKSCFNFYSGNDDAGLEDYNKTKNKNADNLTIEEYELLKEVLW